MFLITFVLFYFKKIGGGDAKLISVFSLWAGVSGLMPLLFIMAIMGGVLGAVTLVVGKYRPAKENSILLKSQWLLGAQSGAREVPYGIAIFTGALFAFWQAGYIQPTGLMALAQETMGY